MPMLCYHVRGLIWFRKFSEFREVKELKVYSGVRHITLNSLNVLNSQLYFQKQILKKTTNPRDISL